MIDLLYFGNISQKEILPKAKITNILEKHWNFKS